MTETGCLDHKNSTYIVERDLEEVNYHLGRIEKTREACIAIAATLTFLHSKPENAIKMMPHFHNKEAMEKILANTMGEFTQKRAVISTGLVSMIEIISDNLEDAKNGIAFLIDRDASRPDTTDM